MAQPDRDTLEAVQLTGPTVGSSSTHADLWSALDERSGSRHPSDEWFVDLLGERGRIATAAGKTLAAMTAIVARFNVLSDGLATAPKRHAPIFEKTDDGLALPQPWCTGFLTAMRLRSEQRRPLLDLGHIHHGLMLPILLYCDDLFGQPLLGPPREGSEAEEFLRTAYHDIPLVLPEIHDYWMPQRLREGDRQS